jgi:hypothetical protein
LLQLQNNKSSSQDIWCYLGNRVLPETRSRPLEAVTDQISKVQRSCKSLIQLDQQERQILKDKLIRPLLRPFVEHGFKETSKQTPCYFDHQKGGFVTFVLGPNIRNLTFDRSEQLLENTNQRNALMFFGFKPDLQLGTLDGVELPYTQARPIGYLIVKSDGVNTEQQNRVVGSPEFMLVLCEQIGDSKVSSERLLVLHAKRREVSSRGVDEGSEHIEDNCTLLYADSCSLFWDCKSAVFKRNSFSDKSHLVFKLDNLGAGQRLVARDWLAFLKRFIDSLPYQLEKRAKVKVIKY